MSEQSNRDAARSKAFGGSPSDGELIEFDGARYRVVKPSLRDIERSEELGTKLQKVGVKSVKRLSKFRQSAALLTLTVFDPDSGKPIFEPADIDAIMAARGNPLFDELGKAARRLSGALSVEEHEGNSDGSPSDDS